MYRANIPVQSTWSVHNSFGVHCSDQEAKRLALQKGIRIDQYLDDWLVRARSHQTCLQQTLVALCQDLGWLVNMDKIRTGPQPSLRCCRLPVRPERGQDQTHPGPVADTDNQNQRIINRTDLSGLATHVHHRAVNSKQVHLG